MAYVETVGLIVSLLCLPLLGFFLGQYRTVERLSGEQNRASELRDIHDQIEHNHTDIGEQIRAIYDTIEYHRDGTGDKFGADLERT